MSFITADFAEEFAHDIPPSFQTLNKIIIPKEEHAGNVGLQIVFFKMIHGF